MVQRGEPEPGAAAPTEPRWEWKRSATTVGLVLGGVGSLNVWLHGRADTAAAHEAAARRLRALLHEESNLQWRVLAEEGSALHVARRMGELRRQEFEVRDELLGSLAAELTSALRSVMDGYHDAIDHELCLLAVGRLADALEYERTSTVPLFERTDEVLLQAAEAAASAAMRARAQATSTLVAALVGVLLLVGALFRRSQTAHGMAAQAVAERLEQEREVSASLERARAMVHHQATHDPLTGLPNRLGLRERLREFADTTDQLLCVVFLDLDGFKVINDRFGHEEGDRVLGAVADALRDAVRGGEVAARVGGDEFQVVASVPSAAAGQALATRIRDRVTETCRIEGSGTELGVSVGVAVGPVTEVRELLRDADRAMYDDKRRGRTGARR